MSRLSTEEMWAMQFAHITCHIHDDDWATIADFDDTTKWFGTCPACRACDHSQKTCESCEHLPVLNMREAQRVLREALNVGE